MSENIGKMGFDTIKLYLEDYETTINPNLIIKPASCNISTGEEINAKNLFIKENGDIVAGAGAYGNYKNNKVIFNANGNFGATIIIQTPQLDKNDNIELIQDLTDAIKTTGKILKENGIKCNINHSKVSRLDLTKNILIDKEYKEYIPAFNNLNPSSKFKNNTICEDTYYFGTQLQKFVIYDNKEAAREKGLLLPSEIARIESRTLKTSKNKSLYGVSNVIELLRRQKEVIQIAKEDTIKNLFRADKIEIENIGAGDIANQIENLIPYCKDNKEVCLYLSIEKVDINSIIKGFVIYWKKKGVDSKVISTYKFRIKTTLQQIQNYNQMIKDLSKKKNLEYNKLYNELRNKYIYD
jgi:hypothetical protein